MNNIHILISNISQLEKIYQHTTNRIYIDAECSYNNIDLLEKYNINELYLAAPFIFRSKDEDIIAQLLDTNLFKGILIRNLEELGFINEHSKYNKLDVVLDSSIYILNKEAINFIISNSKANISEYYNSLELTDKEIEELTSQVNIDLPGSSVIYGRVPMMISANCINKTLKNCSHVSSFNKIKDRKNNTLFVYNNCLFCYNIIYNTIPTSLHKYVEELLNIGNVRLDFTNESDSDVLKIYDYFRNYKKINGPLFEQYTNGLYKRGVL